MKNLILKTNPKGQSASSVYYGIIEGSLDFIDHNIPNDIEVCAENLNTDKTYCTKDQIIDAKYAIGKGYKIEVPEGNYYIYSYSKNKNPNYKAYFTEFVECGMTSRCKSHNKIMIKVQKDITLPDIDPIDWYDPKQKINTTTSTIDNTIGIIENTDIVQSDQNLEEIEKIYSSKASIANFAENWPWSKENNRDGLYGETIVELDISKIEIENAYLSLSSSYSKQNGTVDAEVYISTNQILKPSSITHDYETYWYGNEIQNVESIAKFTSTYRGSNYRFDITEFIKNNSNQNTFYIAVKNLGDADIGVSGIMIETEVNSN